jgi:hypothetical protein
MNPRRVDMGDTLHPLFTFHPAAAIGSLVANSPIGGVATKDAEPLPEPDESRSVRGRLVELLRRPRPAAC